MAQNMWIYYNPYTGMLKAAERSLPPSFSLIYQRANRMWMFAGCLDGLDHFTIINPVTGVYSMNILVPKPFKHDGHKITKVCPAGFQQN